MNDVQHTRNTRQIWPVVIAAALIIAVIAALPLFARGFTQAGEDHTARAVRIAIRTNSAGGQATPRERYENFKLWQADHADQIHDAVDGEEVLALP